MSNEISQSEEDWMRACIAIIIDRGGFDDLFCDLLNQKQEELHPLTPTKTDNQTEV